MNNTRVREKRGDNNLAVYLSEIGRIPLLSREEEEHLSRQMVSGNMTARERLVKANLRFVVNIAKKFQGLGLPLEDLISEGNIGLMSAIDRFDIEKGCRFISYAVWWIRQAIMSALCEKARMIRLPTNRAAELVKIKKARKLVKSRYSSDEEILEVAGLLNMDKDRVKELINISREILSLDTHVAIDNNSVLKDFIEDDRYSAPEEDAEQALMKADFEKVLGTLKKYEADIIRCHYGIGRNAMSLKEIGARYNLSKERIRQIEEKALARLRNPLRKSKLYAYVA